MVKSKIGKRVCLLITAIVAAIFTLCASITFLPVFTAQADTASTNNERVSMHDIYYRYTTDYVLGPIDVQNTYTEDETDGVVKYNRNDLFKTGQNAGQFKYKAGNYELDANNNKVKDTCPVGLCKHQLDEDGYHLTNNVYGIPADKYFDVESYIYTLPNTNTDEGGRVLYGWKAGIQASLNVKTKTAVVTDDRKTLAENGEMMEANALAATEQPIGIYVTYFSGSHSESLKDFGTTERYALIVPDDVTRVGQGSAGFAAKNGNTITTYYAGNSNGTYDAYKAFSTTSGTYHAEYTDFACFITDRQSGSVKVKTAPYFWQPRERLAGVYFTENSNLKVIEGSTDSAAAAEGQNRTSVADKGKSAFQGCDNLRFMILPNGVQTIGNYAFNSCTIMVDTNIPSTVESVGKSAYNNCKRLAHITIPKNQDSAKTISVDSTAFSGCSGLAQVDNLTGTSLTHTLPGSGTVYNDTIYVMSNKPENGATDAGTFMFKKSSATSLSALQLAGQTGEDADKVFVFPKIIDFVSTSDRRKNVKYDYLGANGEKYLYAISTSAATYDIAADFASDIWCQNVVLPKGVKTIGEKAFYNSKVKYLETYATSYGANAFWQNDEAISPQWYYIHREAENDGTYANTYSIESDAFTKGSSVERHIVYENKALYDAASGNISRWNGNDAFYQIPLVAHVNHADNTSIAAFKEGNLGAAFFNDSDYVENPTLNTGNNAIVYAKKLNSRGFTFNKEKTGGWEQDDVLAGKQVSPVLTNMKSTKWYGNEDCSGNEFNMSSYYDSNRNTVSSVDIYTKSVAKPIITNKTYTYGDTENPVPQSNIALIDLTATPGYDSDDYSATITRFEYASGNLATTTPATARDAGTYTVTITLNRDKWGEWDDDYARDFTGTATINRKEIDLGNISNIPMFYTDGGSLLGGATEESARQPITLYRYGTAWYLTEQGDADETKERANAYANFAGDGVNITVTQQSDWNMYNVTPGSGINIASPSGNYMAAFNLSVITIDNSSETNYTFVYTSLDENKGLFDSYGLSLSATTTSSAVLGKEWFIVMQPNKFIDSEVTDFDPSRPYATPSYVVARDKTDNSVKRTWDYEDTNIDIRLPKIAFDQNYIDGVAHTVEPTFTLAYSGAESPLTGEEAVSASELKKYINSAMPVGTYTIVMYAPSVTDESGKNYPEFSENYTVNVTPKALDSAELEEKLKNGGEAYEFAYDGKLHLHDSVDAELLALNNSLNTQLASADENNYWKDKYDLYYGIATITYNLDRMGSTVYYAEDALSAPINADNYTVYYCISAKNYKTVGGEDKEDESDEIRRSKKFLTLIYNEVTVSSLFGAENNDYYLQHVTYSGTTVQTVVPYNALYKTEYNDELDYINARKGATATVTLLDKTLSRWKDDLSDAQRVRINTSDMANGVVTVLFDINPAQNKWTVTPQMPSWTFNGFNRNLNVITSGLAFNSPAPAVKYRLGRDETTGDATVRVWTEYFTVDSNGVINGVYDAEGKTLTNDAEAVKAFIEKLNLLKPASYYLESVVADIPSPNGSETDEAPVNNVTGFTFVLKDGNNRELTSLTVGKASNRWTSTPYILPWTWGEYGADRNTLSAMSLYPSALPDFAFGTVSPVEYQILKRTSTEGGYSDTKLVGLSQDASGNDFWFTEVTDDIAALLGKLDAGRYVLRAKLDGNDYYENIEFSDTQFDIAVAQNRWQFSPNIVRWVWGNYDKNINVPSATPLHTAEGAAVKYTVLNSDYELVFDALKNFTSITASEETAFKALGAGNYFIVASYPGTANFNAINDWGDDYDFSDKDKNQTLSPVQFNIGEQRNTWATTPGVTGWQYKNFNTDNFMFGIPVNGAASDVTYTLSRTDGGTFAFGGTNATSFAINKVEDDAAIGYTVSEAGVLSLTSATVEAFKNLFVIKQTEGQPAVTYQIVAEMNKDENGNYSDITATLTFSVIKATNTWSTRPIMTSWVYGEFTELGNFTAGVPALAENADAKVVYKVHGGKLDTDLTLETEVKNGKTVLTAASVQALKGLAVAGNYTLTVEYAGTDNYDGLVTPITFGVTQIANTWKTTPSITGWTYKSYTDSFIAGAPALPEGGVVTYKLYAANYAAGVPEGATALITFENITDVVDAKSAETTDDDVTAQKYFETLGYSENGYTLVASITGTSNYTGLEQRITFRVAKLVNSWNPTPAMSGWAYNGFVASNFRAGVPTTTESTETVEGNEVPATVKYTVQKGEVQAGDTVTYTNLPDHINLEYSVLAGKLNNLDAGSYKLLASYAGTNNYDALPYEVEFTVTPAQNSWAPSPRLTSYQYKQFDANSNFIAGVPTYPAENKVVHYAILSGAAPETVDTLEAFDALPGVHFTSITDAKYTSVKDGTATEINASVTDYLNSLTNKDGGYVFVAFAEGANNYTHLYVNAQFAVSGTSNAWDTSIPNISGWTYGAFSDSLLTAGVALHGEVKYTVQTVKQTETESGTTETLETVSGFGSIDFDTLKNSIGGLHAGNYNLHAEVAGNADYASVSRDIRFAVAKANNSWTSNGKPDLDKNNWQVGGENGKATTPQATYAVDEIAEKGGYSALYYTAVATGGGWTYAGDGAEAQPTDAGTYFYVVIAPETTDYNKLVNEYQFTISAAGNSWKITPEERLEWVWGKQDEKLVEGTVDGDGNLSEGANKLINATALHGDGAYTIRVAGGNIITFPDADGKDTVTDKTNIKERLSGLGVGNYTIISTVTSKNNYAGVTATTALTVTAANLAWSDDTSFAADGYGWTWGDETKTLFGALTSASVKTAKDSDTAAIAYEVKQNGNIVTGGNKDALGSYDAMQKFVTGLGAGEYEIVITASCANHNDLTQTVNVSIGFAEFTWSGVPTDTEWFWNDKDDSAKILPENAPVANLVNGTATLKYEVHDSIEKVADCDTFDALKIWLRRADVKAYTVRIIADAGADNDNYKASTNSKSFKVNVKQATNDWKPGFAPSDMSRNYREPIENVVVPQSLFGTVVITDDDKGLIIPDFAKWVNETCDGAGDYNFTVTVAADEKGNYTGLSITKKLTIIGMGGGWEPFERNVEFEYNAETFVTDIGNVKIPYKAANSELNEEFRYNVSYKPYIGNVQNSTTLTTAADVTKYLKQIQTLDASFGAGVYTITAAYDPHNNNYASLNDTVTITVNKATIAWEDKTWNYNINKGGIYSYDGYEKAYQGFGAVPTPSAGDGHTVKYVITGGEEPAAQTDIVLAGYLNGLDVGTYIVMYSVEATNNYTGLDPVSIMVKVNQAAIEWKNFDDINGKEYRKYIDDTNYDIIVPQSPLRDPAQLVLTVGEQKFGYTEDKLDNESVNAWLVGLANTRVLKPSDIGYKLEFTVKGTVNYNALNYTTYLYLSKHVGSAPTALGLSASSVDYGTAITVTSVPKFTLDNGTVIADTEVKYTLNGAAHTYAEIVSMLSATGNNALKADTYTLTASVDESDTYLGATSSVTFTVNKLAVKWTDDTLTALNGIKGKRIAFNSEPNLPVLEYSPNWTGSKVTYAYNGKDLDDGKTWSDIVYKGAGVGTYVFTVRVEGNENYQSIEPFEVTIFIEMAGLAWNDGVESKTVTETFNENHDYGLSSKLVEPTLNVTEGCTVSFTLNSVAFDGTWNELLAEITNAGTYTIVATAGVGDGYDNTIRPITYTVTINPITVEWTLDGNTITETELARRYGSVNVDYNSFDNVLPALSATHDRTVAFYIVKDGGDEKIVGDWNAYIKALGASDNAYTLKAVVAEDENGNYTDLEFEITLKINKRTVSWNTDTIENRNIGWTWNGNYEGAIDTPELVNADDNVTVVYSYSADGVVDNTKTNWGDIIAAVRAGKAGVHTVTVTPTVTDANKDNYTLAAPLTYTFTIAKKPVEWTKASTDAAASPVVWTWNASGTYGDIAEPALVDASGCTVSYRLASVADGAETAIPTNEETWAAKLAALKTQNVGTYKITVTVTATDNYTLPSGLEYNFTINKKPVAWTDATNNATKEFNWTFANDKDSYGYKDIAAPTLDADDCGITYTISGVAGTYAVWSDVLELIAHYAVGSYTVTATPSVAGKTDNYSLPNSIGYKFNIVTRTTNWDNATLTSDKSFGWVWGSAYDTTVVKQPVLIDDTDCVISYTLDGVKFDTWSNALAELKLKGASEHTLTVSVSVPSGITKPQDLVYTFTLTQKPVDWSEAETEFEREYNESHTYAGIDVPALADASVAASFNYTLAKKNGNAISTGSNWTDILRFLDGQNAGTYTITVKATESSGNYAMPADRVYTITVNPITVTWIVDPDGPQLTATELDNNYATRSMTYGDTKKVLPVLSASEGRQVKFYLQNDDGNVELGGKKYIEVSDWNASVKGLNASATAYVFKAVAAADANGNYTGLELTVELTINQKPVGWNGDTVAKTTFDWTWGDEYEEVPEPALDSADCKVTFTYTGVTVSGDATWEKIIAAIKGSDNGTYTVTATPVENDSYNISAQAITYTFNIAKREVTWKPETIVTKEYSWIWNADKTAYGNVTAPELNNAGGVTVAYKIAGESGTYPTWAAVIDVIKGKPARAEAYTVTVELSVATGDINYTLPENLTYTFTISEKAVDWTTDSKLAANAVYDWTWNKDGNYTTVAAPEHDGGAGFSIGYVLATVGGGTENFTAWLDAGEVKGVFDALKAKGAGTYTVTAKVTATGSYSLPSDLVYSFTIGKKPVDWSGDTKSATKSFVWTWGGAYDEITAPAAADTDGANLNFVLRRSGEESTIRSSADFGEVYAELIKQTAGTYEITATATATSGNYNVIAEELVYTVTINRAANGWKSHIGENATVAWVYNDPDNTAIVYEAQENNAAMQILVNNSKWSASAEYPTLNEYLASRGVGTYTISVTVPESDTHGSISETITLTVSYAPNSWTTYMSVGSDGVTAADGVVAAHGWTWNNGTPVNSDRLFTAPVSAVGDEVNINVYRVTVSGDTRNEVVIISATFGYRTESGKRVANANDVTAFLTRLFALDAGSYKIAATIAQTGNYSALGGNEVEFVVKQAKNDWIQEPHVQSVSFGSNRPNPVSQAKFGRVQSYEYAYAVDENKEHIAYEDVTQWYESGPIEASTYYVRGKIEGTDNYTALEGYSEYTIGAGANTWVNMPGVIEWTWNNYDRTVNLFSGSARSNGKASFTILKGTIEDRLPLDEGDFTAINGVDVATEQISKLTKFELTTASGAPESENDKARFVSAELESLLNALKPGTYVLYVEIAGGSSLTGISGSTYFTVGKASNEWKSEAETPSVLSFVHGSFIEVGDRMSFTAGVTKYGTNNVWYKVVGTDNDNAEVDSGKKNQADIVAYIKALKAGNYNLQAWADGGETYGGFYIEAAPYSKQFNVTRAQNGWKENNAPAENISVKYAALQALTTIDGIFAAPIAVSGTDVEYDILNGNQSVRVSGLTYGELLAALKNLPFGEYIIRSRVEMSCNYTSLFGNTALSVTRESNALEFNGKALDSNGVTVGGAWREEGGNDLTDFKAVTAEHGDMIIYTYAGNKYLYNTAALDGKDIAALGLQNIGIFEFMQAQNAGTYNINVSVDGTDEYEGASGLISLVIAPAENAWSDGWTIDRSIKVGDSVVSPATWEWSSVVTWLGTSTKYGNTIEVTVAYADEASSDRSAALFYSIITVDGANYETQIKAVGEALTKLLKGVYVISVKAPASTNWEELNTEKLRIEVVKTDTNKWTSATGEEAPPKFVNIAGDAVEEWNYGTSVSIFADSTFGEYAVEYYELGENGKETKLDGMPVDAGSYKAVFTVPATDEYNDLIHNINFTINQIEYEAFNVVPGIVSWTWSEYARFDNLFTGSARSGGKVSYTVFRKSSTARAVGEVVEINGVKLENIKLVDRFGVRHDDPSRDLYVPEDTAELLAQLPAGDYVLAVNFDETRNYLAFTPEVLFTVAVAHNEWTTIPSVAPWAVGAWTEASTPVAVSKFGKPSITIIADSGKYVVYSSVWDETLNDGEGGYRVVNKLNETLAGWYTMTATVGVEENKYDALPDYTYRFQIFLEGTEFPANRWSVAPNIKWWSANTDNVYGEITGTPVRGKAYFEFYHAERVNGELIYDKNNMIEAGADVLTVEAGEIYYRDFYVPMKPGSYVMIAKAEYVNLEGTYIEDDYLEYTPVYFEIGNRANSFEQDVRIDTVLYLGEKDTWSAKYPTAKAVLEGSEITYEFSNAETGEKLGASIPTTPGKYKVTAKAVATYSEPIYSEIEFTVALSQNSWVNDQSPTIEGWSEEFSDTAPDPKGAAKFGTIVYTYVNVLAPDVVLTEKPLTAGTYIMYATVELDGYVTLESSYQFTIEEAFDSTFLLIDIILGLVACAFAVVVIIFAIRRYKENG